jgi:serine protease Do
LIQDLLPEVDAHTSYDLLTFQDDITDMIAQARGSVIGIITETAEGIGTGSGVIYKNVDGTYFVVTNHHVVENGTSFTIVYERSGLLFEINNSKIELLGSDETTDLAVLTFESSQLFPVIEISDSYDIELGQFVFAIGNPLGFDYYGTVTMGVVSGLSRYVLDESTGFNATLLQHDAAISPGNSGGALLNANGELIGINNMKLVDDNVSLIGFAIPSNTVKRIAEDLEDDGEVTRPYLGITTNALVNNCGNSTGVCAEIQEGGAADAAGLEDYDVIVGYKNEGMDDYLLINNFNDLKEAILNSKVGESIQLQYYRNNILYESLITELGIHPDD